MIYIKEKKLPQLNSKGTLADNPFTLFSYIDFIYFTFLFLRFFELYLKTTQIRANGQGRVEEVTYIFN